jgi:hypothetical protein
MGTQVAPITVQAPGRNTLSGLDQFRLHYEYSPIVLTGGIAGDFPGKVMAIIQLLQNNDFDAGTLQSPNPIGFSDYVAHFQPMPGGTLIDVAIGEYPFANQAVAANAIIMQPLKISLMMVAPALTFGGYTRKVAAFTSLQQTLYKHMRKGGLFNVATPSFVYQDCILQSLRDITNQGESLQVQTRWQWDFVQPLLTVAAAQAAQSDLISAYNNGDKTANDPPNQVASPSAASGIAQILTPAQTPLQATSGGVGDTGGGTGGVPF